MNKIQEKQRKIISILIILLLGFSLWFFSNIVVYFLIAYIVSLFGTPVYNLLSNLKIGKIKIPDSLTAFLSLLAVWAVFFTIFALIIPLLANEAKVLSEIKPEQITDVFKDPINSVETLFDKFNDSDKSFTTFIQETTKKVIDFSIISDSVKSVGSLLTNFIVGAFAVSFISFFFFKDSYMFFRIILYIVPDKYDSRFKYAMIKTQKLLTRYFIGLLIEMLLVAILITIGMLIIGLEFQHAMVIGIFAGLLNIIPYVGPIISAFFGIIITSAVNLDLDFYNQLLPLIGYTALVFAIVQLSDNIIFQPIIYSNSVSAHPLEIFVVILAAGSLAGIPGMILAVPTYTIFRIFASVFLDRFKVINTLTKDI